MNKKVTAIALVSLIIFGCILYRWVRHQSPYIHYEIISTWTSEHSFETYKILSSGDVYYEYWDLKKHIKVSPERVSRLVDSIAQEGFFSMPEAMFRDDTSHLQGVTHWATHGGIYSFDIKNNTRRKKLSVRDLRIYGTLQNDTMSGLYWEPIPEYAWLYGISTKIENTVKGWLQEDLEKMWTPTPEPK